MELILVLISILMALASAAVWGVILVRWACGDSLYVRPVPVSRPRGLFALILLSLWLGQALWSEAQHSETPRAPVQITMDQAAEMIGLNVALQVFVSALFLFALSEMNSRSLTRFGITVRHWEWAVLFGVLGYLAAVLPVYLATLTTLEFRSDATVHPFLQLIRTEGSFSVTVLLFTSAVILAPLSEELIFRVILQGQLQRHVSPTAAILLSSTLFSAIHGFPDVIGLFPLAAVLGFLYWRTGSYLTVVVTHAAFNGVNMTMMMLQPPGDL